MEAYFDFTNPGKWAAIVSGLVLLYLLAIFAINRYRRPKNHADILSESKNLSSQMGNIVHLTIWNIGYAGLGKESDFVTDGGNNWFPPSTMAVKNNVLGIEKTLASFEEVDRIYLLQEVSERSPLSLWQPVRQTLLSLFNGKSIYYRADIASWGVPWPAKINHGTLSICPKFPRETQIVNLPAEPSFLAHIIRRHYALLVTRFAIENTNAQWVIANLHLAAFDPKGATRLKQLEAVINFAESEYAKGNHVILGGDWNMALTDAQFPHTSDLSKLFWLVDFPKTSLPTGWTMVADPKTPTVRTNYQPYIKHQNYTAIIDGFITSPNVKTERIKTTNTNFEHTDHMPVSATFSTKRKT